VKRKAEAERGEEAMDVNRIVIGTGAALLAVLVIAAAIGMRAEYARGEREWFELFQWGAGPYVTLALPLLLAVAIALWRLRSARKRGW
jgi:hypothetical protein